MIIEGAMRLHNFLVDYRDVQTIMEDEDNKTDNMIFENDCQDRGIQTIVVGNDGNNGGRPRGRPPVSEKFYRTQCLKLRDQLRLSLKYHDMHRARQEEWSTDVNTRVVRNLN